MVNPTIILSLLWQGIGYNRTGRCCGFKSPNGMMGTGLLDRYKVYWENSSDTLVLYFNFYDAGILRAPVGFNYRKSNVR